MVAPARTSASSTWPGQSIDQIVMIEQADVLDYDNDTNTGEVVRNFYHRNALGSVMFISEPDETEAATYRYTPYGEQSIERGGSPQGTDPLGQSIGYTGRWRDAESGLWHYRARAYSSAIGRFLQRDPLGYGPGPNVYEYCRSGPTTWQDPLGLRAKPVMRNVPDGKDYSKADEAYSILVAVGPLAAAEALVIATFINNQFPSNDPRNNNGTGDAIKHCWLACELCRAIGEEDAYLVLDLHEAFGNARGQSNAAYKMDCHNNDQGIECCKSPSDCMECCLRAKLAVLLGDGDFIVQHGRFTAGFLPNDWRLPGAPAVGHWCDPEHPDGKDWRKGRRDRSKWPRRWGGELDDGDGRWR